MSQQSMHDFVDGEIVNAAMLTPLKANILDHETRLSAAESGKAAKTVTVTGASGLQGGGDLSANRTITPKYGTAANTVAEGNDSRINNGQTAYTKLGTGVGTNDSDGSTNSGTAGAQIAYLRANAATAGPVVSAYRSSTTQSIPDKNTQGYTVVTVDATVVDSNGMFSSSATDRLTCKVAGTYLVGGVVPFYINNSANGVGQRGCGIYKIPSGGSAAFVPGSFVTWPNYGTGTAVDATANTSVVQLAVGDAIQLVAWQNSGSALSTFVSAPHYPTLWATFLHG